MKKLGCLEYMFVLLVFSFLVISCSSSSEDVLIEEIEKEVNVQVGIIPEVGIMNGDTGEVSFSINNGLDESVKLIKIEYSLLAGVETLKDYTIGYNIELQSGENKELVVNLKMPSDAESYVDSADPYVSGKITYILNGYLKSIDFRIDVPISGFYSPLVEKSYKNVKFYLQRDYWDELEDQEGMLVFMDSVYYQMSQLTGGVPFNGDQILLQETLPFEYWAFSGNPVQLNSLYVKQTMKDWNSNLVSFGWIHELGHDFDNSMGGNYNYGAFIETQANIKLSYVIEKLCTDDSKFKIQSKVSYAPVTGKQFNDEYFLPFGDKFINSGRPWKTMSSDEYHALFLTVIRDKGWEVLERFYDTYRELGFQGDLVGWKMIEFVFAVLDNASGMDLIPLYQDYRIPMNRTTMDSLLEKYSVAKIDKE